MNREDRFAARIAFRLPETLHNKLDVWAQQEDRPLANLVYTIVKQAVAEREKQTEKLQLQKEAK